MLIEPLALPQVAFVCDDVALGGVMAVTLCVPATVQALAAVTVTVYEPTASGEMLDVVFPLLHKYVYGAVPPVGFTEIIPFDCEHVALVTEKLSVGDGALVMFVLCEYVQPLKSVTVNV